LAKAYRWGKFGLKIIHSISDVEKKSARVSEYQGNMSVFGLFFACQQIF